jgi:hypothetical protein
MVFLSRLYSRGIERFNDHSIVHRDRPRRTPS